MTEHCKLGAGHKVGGTCTDGGACDCKCWFCEETRNEKSRAEVLATSTESQWHEVGGCDECSDSEEVEYSVWVQIERADKDGHDNYGLPDKLDTFKTFEEAAGFVRTMPGWAGPYAKTSDYRYMPFVVGETEVNHSVIARFETEDEAAAFIDTLPDHKDGRYYLDSPEAERTCACDEGCVCGN